MNKFKVGDLLIGTKTNPYGITNQWTIVEVLDISDDGAIYVKVIKLHPTTPDDVKQTYKSQHYMGFRDWVNPNYFKLYNDKYYYNPELNKFGYFEDKEGLIRV